MSTTSDDVLLVCVQSLAEEIARGPQQGRFVIGPADYGGTLAMTFEIGGCTEDGKWAYASYSMNTREPFSNAAKKHAVALEAVVIAVRKHNETCRST